MDDSDLRSRYPPLPQQQQQQQQQQMSSGLTRYRSAPSSYFANLMNGSGYGGEDFDPFLNSRDSSPETERMFARFMQSSGSSGGAAEDSTPQNLNAAVQAQFVPSMKPETGVVHLQQQQQQQQIIYQNQIQPPDHKSVVTSDSIMDTSYNLVSSPAMDSAPQMKMGGGGGNASNLIRHSSSPAGLFNNIHVENGYAVLRGVGNFGAGSNTNAASSSGLMPHVSETGGKNMGGRSPEGRSFGEGHRNDGGYITGYPSGSWDDSAMLSDNFLNELGENDRKTFQNMNSSENQNGDSGARAPTMLAHHLSLPTSSAELSAMENLFQFQDSVPLKIRAKRGCATHPRSIAERVRRTRISERMRKLQELVPNMDKQTNTADMLDLAVDYIKDLQKEVKALSTKRAKCTCPNMQKQ